MAKIKIKDLPKDYKITEDEMKRIRGGAINTFINIDSINGESSDEKHKNEIEVLE